MRRPFQGEEHAAERRKRDEALADMERWQGLRYTYLRLLEAIENELETATEPKRITTLRSKQATTEEKVIALDGKIAKAYDVAHAA